MVQLVRKSVQKVIISTWPVNRPEPRLPANIWRERRFQSRSAVAPKSLLNA
jgi:hypothetical protein